MKTNNAQSAHQEVTNVHELFDTKELRRLRLLLRRLRFLETKADRGAAMADASNNGGAAFVEWEAEALEFVLTEIGFLKEKS